MLAEVFKYSGAHAKVKAMTGKLLKEKDYDALLSKSSIGDVAAYLKSNTKYKDALAGVSETDVHRGQLEQLLLEVKENEFAKLFKYEKGNNKRFLAVFILRYEIELLKEMFRMVESGILFTFDRRINEYYRKHMTIDADKLAASKTKTQFIENLKGTPYNKLLSPFISNTEHFNIFGIEMTLDVYYFVTAWKSAIKLLGKKDRRIVSRSLGSEMDILNLLWIFRSKKFYNIPSELIYSYIIPIKYRLRQEQIAELVTAGNIDEVYKLLDETVYSEIFKEKEGFTEQYFYDYMMKLQRKAARYYPFSIMTMLLYIHQKDNEVGNIIKITEGIRYKLDMNKIKHFLIGIGGDKSGS